MLIRSISVRSIIPIKNIPFAMPLLRAEETQGHPVKPLPLISQEMCFTETLSPQLTKKKLRGPSPRANYNDRATAACWLVSANFCGERVSCGLDRNEEKYAWGNLVSMFKGRATFI
jgi:hypothetical protein